MCGHSRLHDAYSHLHWGGADGQHVPATCQPRAGIICRYLLIMVILQDAFSPRWLSSLSEIYGRWRTVFAGLIGSCACTIIACAALLGSSGSPVLPLQHLHQVCCPGCTIFRPYAAVPTSLTLCQCAGMGATVRYRHPCSPAHSNSAAIHSPCQRSCPVRLRCHSASVRKPAAHACFWCC